MLFLHLLTFYMHLTMHQFLIAAPHSGSGKTTLARGLMALYTQKGYVVQPYKCGPDYIDTKFHAGVCQRQSVNLDTFMATPDHVGRLYSHYAQDADICVVEGMMGLFDGYDRDRGSTAEIARVLSLPVVLVVDARSAAYSTAAMLSGFMHFRKDVRIQGVIFNKVGSSRHADMLREVCDDLSLTCYGCVPKDERLENASRYLGLDFSAQADASNTATMIERHVDWQRLLDDTQTAHPYSSPHATNSSPHVPLRVLMARNEESFSFVYQETVDSCGQLTTFDPEHDVPDFTGIDLLYLPGGYPEKHLEALAKAGQTRQAIRDYALNGGRIVAECGGMMYLCNAILADDGQDGSEETAFPMCGVLPYTITARRADRRLSLGYRQFTLGGRHFRGHEFHYTRFVGNVPPSAAQVYNAKGMPVDSPVIVQGNVFASYIHLMHPSWQMTASADGDLL